MAVLSPNDALGVYTIRSLLGAGGMGEVYRAHDARLDRFVAIKILRQGVMDDGARARFSREARTVAKLRHPNVVPVFDVGEHDGLPFLVMELVDGPSLAAIIHERRPVPLESKLRYVVDLCDALSHAHERGIIHRDVKPSNVLIDDGRARLTDFGIALDTESTSTSVGGSPNYFAPEQLEGTGDHRADLFSLGALFYELLTGTRAFPGSVSDGVLYRIVHEPAPLLPPHVGGAEMAEVVSRALDKSPDGRFQSAAEFKTAVARASGVAAASTAATALPQPQSDVTRFRRRLLESAVPAEIRRLKYEVDQYLARQPYDVDGRMLSDEIERALVVSVAPASTLRPVTGGSSWRRPALYASTVAVAVLAVSTFVMQRDAPRSTSSPVATTALPADSSGQASRSVDGPSATVGSRATATAPRPTMPSPASPTTALPSAKPAASTQPPPPAVAPASPPAPVPGPPPAADGAFRSFTSAPAADAIGQSIRTYEAAYARRDVTAVEGVYPSVDARALTAAFDRYDTLRYTIQIRTRVISGDTATVDAVIDRSGELKAGGTESLRSPVTIRLRRRAGGWVIEAIEAVP